MGGGSLQETGPGPWWCWSLVVVDNAAGTGCWTMTLQEPRPAYRWDLFRGDWLGAELQLQ